MESSSEEEAIQGYGHLCFECYRTIKLPEMITVTFVGSLPIYHHTSCHYGEEKTQTILTLAAITNNPIFKEGNL